MMTDGFVSPDGLGKYRGLALGQSDGSPVGLKLGYSDEWFVGDIIGANVGIAVGINATDVGCRDGTKVGNVDKWTG